VIIVECYKDQALVHRMGFIPEQVEHEHGRSRVLGRLEELEQKQKAVGIIDEDPDAGRPTEYLEKYEERIAIGKIKLLIRKDDDGKKAIQISPYLEDWLYAVAKRNRIFPEKFNLPVDPAELHNLSLRRDRNFRRFLIELNKAKDGEIDTLKEWITEAFK